MAFGVPLVLALLLLLNCLVEALSCQLPHDWRPQTESCRAELAEIIVFAKVLAVYKDSYSVYNYLPWQDNTDLFFSAEIELLCDQAWGSMLEVPAGSRFNVTGLGYFPCHSYTVMEGNTYYFFLRMDENYNLVPHGVNFQDPIFPDSPENQRMFASLFQFANCSSGTLAQAYTPDWEAQEDSRLLCSTVQKALLEEEEHVKTLLKKVRVLEKANNHLKNKVRKMKSLLRQAKKESKQEALLLKKQQQQQKVKDKAAASHPKVLLNKPPKKLNNNNKLKK
ncbi:coiled-coil domain-containing protein 3 [Polypterus senegalus]